jgi:hypothetical protein
MNLTPLLLASRIPEMIRSPATPNMLRNLLPRYLWWRVHAHTHHSEGVVCTLCFGVVGNSFAEESDLFPKQISLHSNR